MGLEKKKNYISNIFKHFNEKWIILEILATIPYDDSADKLFNITTVMNLSSFRYCNILGKGKNPSVFINKGNIFVWRQSAHRFPVSADLNSWKL